MVSQIRISGQSRKIWSKDLVK